MSTYEIKITVLVETNDDPDEYGNVTALRDVLVDLTGVASGNFQNLACSSTVESVTLGG